MFCVWASIEINKSVEVVNLGQGLPSIQEITDTILTCKNKRMDIDELWLGIKACFLLPLRKDDVLSYVPSQYVSGLLKNLGYDGIRYESVQRKGNYNIVLFDRSIATIKTKGFKHIVAIEYIDSGEWIRRKMEKEKQ